MNANDPLFRRLDHIAIVVRSTEDALAFYRDTMGLPVLLSEEIETGKVRLTHLDMGNLHLQLVEPLTEDHPLINYLNENGEGLHHLCFETDNVQSTFEHLGNRGLKPKSEIPHDGPRGKKAGFIDPATARGVIWEMTDKGPSNESRP